MKAMSQPTAFHAMKDYFSPISFRAEMDSPASIQVTLIYPPTGETVGLSDVPCTVTLTCADMFTLIHEIESRLVELKPGFLHKLDLSRYVG
jgi:hypothetical protein